MAIDEKMASGSTSGSIARGRQEDAHGKKRCSRRDLIRDVERRKTPEGKRSKGMNRGSADIRLKKRGSVGNDRQELLSFLRASPRNVDYGRRSAAVSLEASTRSSASSESWRGCVEIGEMRLAKAGLPSQ